MMKHALYALGLVMTACFAGALTSEDYQVTELPGIDIEMLNFTQHAGHIEVNKDEYSHLFFWMTEQANRTQDDKLIFWLNGGPGCSSMDGFFLENGPFRVNKDLTLSLNPGGWQDRATVVYVDQPAGTGFSYANTDTYVATLEEVTKNFVVFLDKFFDLFPYLEGQDMYISGESFAGTYIPYIATELLRINAAEEDEKYNLQGIAIGNGWISPEHQYLSNYDFAMNNNLLKGAYADNALKHADQCRKALAEKDQINIPVCEEILADITYSSKHRKSGKDRCINQYDIRLTEEDYPACGRSWPYELQDMTSYLRQKDLLLSIHVNPQALGWRECDASVGSNLNTENSTPAYKLLPDILKKIPILLFNGEYDLICNILGIEYLTGNMTWNGEQGFQSAETKPWYIGSNLVGYYTEARGLTNVLIKEGSHMVSYDRAIETLDMINRFIGVGDDTVLTMPSRVGELIKEPTSPNQPPKEDEEKTPSSDTDDGYGSDDWSEYKSWGSKALVVVILLALVAACMWYRSKNGERSEPQRQGASSVFHWARLRLRRLFRGRGRRSGNHLRLNDQDDTNELDELVVENPTLFAADDDSGSDPDHQHPPQGLAGRFAIVNEDDNEDYDDFADWDEESPKEQTKKPKHTKDA